MNDKTDWDVIVVGSGPNGLAASIYLQQAGLSVLLIEGDKTIGGGMRTSELTLPGYRHDVCSAIHPMAALSPYFESLPLEQFGLEFIYPGIAAAHPFDGGKAAILKHSLTETAEGLSEDRKVYIDLLEPIVKSWSFIRHSLLAPLQFPDYPAHVISFGFHAIKSAKRLSNSFRGKHAKGLWAGMAAHAIQPLTNTASSAIGLVLLAAAHLKGWPLPKGGSDSIANALSRYFVYLGGTIQTNFYVKSLSELPTSKAVLFDTAPRQLLQIAGHKLSTFYKYQLKHFRYGMGVFKIDYALSEPVPFTNEDCRRAGTIHLGNTFEEIANAEYHTSKGRHPDRPFVLAAQQSVFDESRAPRGKHTFWAYCHVPNGSTKDCTATVESQIERFAPGFRDLILERHTMNTAQLQDYNPNYIGGDINGGLLDIRQLFSRPALRYSPYRTSAKGIYICSASTPPGGGVHGMCGYHAARKVIKDLFPDVYKLNKKTKSDVG